MSQSSGGGSGDYLNRKMAELFNREWGHGWIIEYSLLECVSYALDDINHEDKLHEKVISLQIVIMMRQDLPET